VEISVRGVETPQKGMETTKDVLETTKDSLQTSVRGLETPEDVLENPQKAAETTKDVLETTKDSLQTSVRGLETTKEELKTTRDAMGGSEPTNELEESLETTREAMGGLETTIPHHLEQDKGLLETPPESKGSPETTGEVPGSTEGSLEMAVTHCLEQGWRSKGGLETTRAVLGGLKTTSRRKAGLKTPRRPKGDVGAAEPQHLDWGTSGNGGLETTGEGLETTRETTTRPEASLETTSAVILLGEEDEDDDEEEEEEERDEGPRRYLEALEAVQIQLEAVEEEAARALRRLRARIGMRRRPHLQRRNRLIQHIPGFWVTAFLNHPQLSAMISDRDEDALSYMTSLQEFGQSRPGWRIRFFFSVNPYFQNDVVAKESVRGPSGHLMSHSTPIRWWQGQDPRSRPHKGPPAPRSFFAWFGDHSFPAGDRVA
ncbi:TSYL2 protein, partial [Scytalopus superciliaris]|nr:TSYL2 protein [Scytalopus superciliaris]